MIVGPILILLVGAGITALTRGGGETKAPRVQALRLLVINPPDDFESAPAHDPATGGTAVGSRQAERAKPRVDVRLHNVGTRRSVLTSARFVITRHARIGVCGVGAELPSSASYDVMLPARPRRGQVIEVPINQQLGPDEADRFSFRLGTEEAYKADLGTTVIYEMDVSILHDTAPQPLKVGAVVVAVPAAPTRWPQPPPYGDFAESGCTPVPGREDRTAATFRGARSPELAAFLRFVKAS